MKKSTYTSYDELPLLLNVKQLVDLMGVPRRVLGARGPRRG